MVIHVLTKWKKGTVWVGGGGCVVRLEKVSFYPTQL